MRRRISETKRGIGLVEVVVAAAVITLVVLSLISAYLFHFRIGLEIAGRVQATLLAEEAIEAVKFLRDESWSTRIDTLALDQPYYLLATSTVWEATTTPYVLLGKFSRTVLFSPVNRDANGDVVSSGGTLDSGTRKVTIVVSWPTANGSTTKSVSAYVSDLFNN